MKKKILQIKKFSKTINSLHCYKIIEKFPKCYFVVQKNSKKMKKVLKMPNHNSRIGKNRKNFKKQRFTT